MTKRKMPPRSAISPRRDYDSNAPRFRDLQENFNEFYSRTNSDKGTKMDEKRKEMEIKLKKIDDLERELQELEKEDIEDLYGNAKIKHIQQMKSLQNRIENELNNLYSDFLPPLTPQHKWKNPPLYDKSTSHLRQVMEVNKKYGSHMNVTQKPIFDSRLEHILAKEKEYAAWKRQIRQNAEEKLRKEGVPPVKLIQKPKMTKMWETKSVPHVKRVYGDPPEYVLEEPLFRHLANVEENFSHLLEADAKKLFYKRFLKAREIELRKQKKREQRIDKARQFLLNKQPNQNVIQPSSSSTLQWKVSRDYVKHEPLFRYIENVKVNFYDYLTPRQKKQIDKKYHEMMRRKEIKLNTEMEKREKWCKEHPNKCIEQDLFVDSTLEWSPRSDYILHEPPFRFYEDIKNQYLNFLPKKQRKTFLLKYEQAKAVEEKRLEKLNRRHEAAYRQNSTNNATQSGFSQGHNDQIKVNREYELADPKFYHLHETWMQFKNRMSENRVEYCENLLVKIAENAKIAHKFHIQKCKTKAQDHGDQIDATKSHEIAEKRKSHINRLATPNLRILEYNYEIYKTMMSEEKSNKIKSTIEKMKPISMEQMENLLNSKKLKRKEEHARKNYQNKHRSQIILKLETAIYKDLVKQTIDKLLRELPVKVLYSSKNPNLIDDQEKIYKTAMMNFNRIPSLAGSQHLHGLSMQVVKFFDKLLK